MTSTSAPWRWELLDDMGGPATTDPSPAFSTQSEAESWLGEMWLELLDDGVDAVTLLEGDTPVYGPMSLHKQH